MKYWVIYHSLCCSYQFLSQDSYPCGCKPLSLRPPSKARPRQHAEPDQKISDFKLIVMISYFFKYNVMIIQEKVIPHVFRCRTYFDPPNGCPKIEISTSLTKKTLHKIACWRVVRFLFDILLISEPPKRFFCHTFSICLTPSCFCLLQCIPGPSGLSRWFRELRLT